MTTTTAPPPLELLRHHPDDDTPRHPCPDCWPWPERSAMECRFIRQQVEPTL